jgi:hypothetical protein
MALQSIRWIADFERNAIENITLTDRSYVRFGHVLPKADLRHESATTAAAQFRTADIRPRISRSHD